MSGSYRLSPQEVSEEECYGLVADGNRGDSIAAGEAPIEPPARQVAGDEDIRMARVDASAVLRSTRDQDVPIALHRHRERKGVAAQVACGRRKRQG